LEVRTHLLADKGLLGSPVSLGEGSAVVELKATRGMAVDDRGLVHGGFTFGVADYAAMLAVNDPLVVLGSAEVRFTAPVRVGETMKATARIEGAEGRRRNVTVEVEAGGRSVLRGTMACFVLARHVLDQATAR